MRIRYRALVQSAIQAEKPGRAGFPGSRRGGREELRKTPGVQDEYEVARLYSRPEFIESLRAQFEATMKYA